MHNNDVLRRVRYILDLDDDEMIQTCASGGIDVTRTQISQWLKKEEDDDYKKCKDFELASFLNGVINGLRGKREGEQPEAEKVLTNNIVLRKIMIAFNLKAEDIIALPALDELKLSKHELSAFFRKPGHKNYRPCKAQILRNCLMGLQIKLRP
jgi:uncharacterized protein YehS (DUF1456 family)